MGRGSNFRLYLAECNSGKSPWIWLCSHLTDKSRRCRVDSSTARLGHCSWFPAAGSVENLNVSRRQRCSPYLRQISATHTFEMPNSLASSRDDQVRHRKPARRRLSKHHRGLIKQQQARRRPARLRPVREPAYLVGRIPFSHAITGGFDTPGRDAISFRPMPSPSSSTTRARSSARPTSTAIAFTAPGPPRRRFLRSKSAMPATAMAAATDPISLAITPSDGL